jgi:hypothetical protein
MRVCLLCCRNLAGVAVLDGSKRGSRALSEATKQYIVHQVF